MSPEERDEMREYRRALVHTTANLLALKFAIRNNLPDVYRLASANLRKEQLCTSML